MPEQLTDDEAAVLRALRLGISLTFAKLVDRGLAVTGFVPAANKAGLKALAEYDERKRREIQAEERERIIAQLEASELNDDCEALYGPAMFRACIKLIREALP